MPYEEYVWKNKGEGEDTPLNKTHLNHLEAGIKGEEERALTGELLDSRYARITESGEWEIPERVRGKTVRIRAVGGGGGGGGAGSTSTAELLQSAGAGANAATVLDFMTTLPADLTKLTIVIGAGGSGGAGGEAGGHAGVAGSNGGNTSVEASTLLCLAAGSGGGSASGANSTATSTGAAYGTYNPGFHPITASSIGMGIGGLNVQGYSSGQPFLCVVGGGNGNYCSGGKGGVGGGAAQDGESIEAQSVPLASSHPAAGVSGEAGQTATRPGCGGGGGGGATVGGTGGAGGNGAPGMVEVWW